MLWVLAALAENVFHGWANILDNYFMNKLIRDPIVLLIISVLVDMVLLPFVFFIQTPVLPPLRLLPFFAIVGFTGIAYLLPYYKALQCDDTSTVTSLFALGKVVVPLLAFLIVGEVLQVKQYFGFFLIVGSSTWVSLNNDHGRLRLNKAFWLMLLCSVILSVEAVVYKYIFNNVTWATGFTWGTVSSMALMFLVFLFKRPQLPRFNKKTSLVVLAEVLTLVGTGAGLYAIALAPVTLVKGILATHPFIVLFYAVLFHKKIPQLFKEQINIRSVLKKIIAFLIMLVGVVLTVS